MSRVATLVIAALFCVSPLTLRAQVCLGGAAFTDHVGQIGVDASSGNSSESATGNLTLGSERGPFGTIGIGTAHDGNLNDYASLFAATAGLDVHLGARPTAQLCPYLSLSTLNGVNLPTGDQANFADYGFGASIGTIVRPEPNFELVPFAGAAYVIQDGTIHTSTPGGSTDLTSDDDFRVMSLGAGLVFAKTVTVRPSVTFLFGHGHTSQSFALHVAVSFGAIGGARPHVEGGGSLASVWVNPRSREYYCQGSRWYGGTADGSFMTEREAIAAGYAPERGKKC